MHVFRKMCQREGATDNMSGRLSCVLVAGTSSIGTQDERGLAGKYLRQPGAQSSLRKTGSNSAGTLIEIEKLEVEGITDRCSLKANKDTSDHRVFRSRSRGHSTKIVDHMVATMNTKSCKIFDCKMSTDRRVIESESAKDAVHARVVTSGRKRENNELIKWKYRLVLSLKSNAGPPPASKIYLLEIERERTI